MDFGSVLGLLGTGDGAVLHHGILHLSFGLPSTKTQLLAPWLHRILAPPCLLGISAITLEFGGFGFNPNFGIFLGEIGMID